jgi:hypothetical protein
MRLASHIANLSPLRDCMKKRRKLKMSSNLRSARPERQDETAGPERPKTSLQHGIYQTDLEYPDWSRKHLDWHNRAGRGRIDRDRIGRGRVGKGRIGRDKIDRVIIPEFADTASD